MENAGNSGNSPALRYPGYQCNPEYPRDTVPECHARALHVGKIINYILSLSLFLSLFRWWMEEVECRRADISRDLECVRAVIAVENGPGASRTAIDKSA